MTVIGLLIVKVTLSYLILVRLLRLGSKNDLQMTKLSSSVNYFYSLVVMDKISNTEGTLYT